MVGPMFLNIGRTGDLTEHPSGKFLYFLSNGVDTGSVGAFAIDPVPGNLTLAFYPIKLATPSIATDLVVTP
jgi:hypothetical protein